MSSRKYICGTQVTNRCVWYVSELRGHGGVDWGYSDSPSNALLMSERMAKIFCNEGPARRFMRKAEEPKA
jgi:hypothetical protein